MQTRTDGTHVILPAAVPIGRRPDRARLPVTMLRQSDGKVRRDGSSAADVQPEHPVAERGGVQGASELEARERRRAVANSIVYSRIGKDERRCPQEQWKYDRLGGRDKRAQGALRHVSRSGRKQVRHARVYRRAAFGASRSHTQSGQATERPRLLRRSPPQGRNNSVEINKSIILTLKIPKLFAQIYACARIFDASVILASVDRRWQLCLSFRTINFEPAASAASRAPVRRTGFLMRGPPCVGSWSIRRCSGAILLFAICSSPVASR